MLSITPVHQTMFTRRLLDDDNRRDITARLRCRDELSRGGAVEGDWVLMPDRSIHRIAYITGNNGHRKTQFARDPEHTYYLEINGLMNYRGNIAPGVPLEVLRKTGTTRPGQCTILHHHDTRLIDFLIDIDVWVCPPLRGAGRTA